MLIFNMSFTKHAWNILKNHYPVDSAIQLWYNRSLDYIKVIIHKLGYCDSMKYV